MFYHFFRILFGITNRFYFRSMEVKGLENIPKSGPIMLAVNHPSTLMDPIIVGTICKRNLFFLAKGTLFNNKLTKSFLRILNLIPIYRTHETPDKMHLNKNSFSECYRHLESGGAILIFPEGISLTDRRVKKIQSGAARICLGAENENDFKLGVQIVPIGLNYSNPHQFQSDLFVSIGKPIHVNKYRAQFEVDSFKAAHALTNEIGETLYGQLVAMADEAEVQLVSQIESIYKAQLLKELGHSPDKMLADFETTKAIRDSIQYFRESAPERVAKARRMIDSYQRDLQRLSLHNQTLDFNRRRSTTFDIASTIIFLILGFPVFLFGFLHNYVPFRLPFWSVKYINKQPEYYGSISYTVGTFAFLIFYTILLNVFTKYSHDLVVNILYTLFLPVSGLFAFRYYKYWQKFKNKWALFSLIYRRSGLISALLTKREKIMDILEKGKADYIKNTSAGEVA